MAFLTGAQTALVSVNARCWVIWHSQSPPVTQERFLLLTNGLWRKCSSRFCGRDEAPGFLSAISNCRQFSSQLHKERLGGGPVQNFGCSMGKKKPLSLFYPAKGRVRGTSSPVPGTTASLAGESYKKHHRHFQLCVKHNGFCLSQGTSSCQYK